MCLSVFITLVKNDYWIFKILEYPRLQKLFLIAVMLIIWAFYFPLEDSFPKISFGFLCLAGVYVAYKVLPYTVLTRREMKKVTTSEEANELSIYAANVFQDNTEYHRVLEQIKQEDPDIVFLLETNKAWENGLAQLDNDYPYSLRMPLENTYGLLFFSRLKMENGEVKFLVKNDIPSIEVDIILRNGTKVKVWGLHPEPPVPGESLYATAKDKELMKVALKARECDCPCIVFGDLNDVAWSHTTELFRKTSRLLDPRRGRGFYATFSAHSRFLRFPLDYIFASPDFGLISMKRMPKNGSDHFATSTRLAYIPSLEKVQEAPSADAEELQEAKEKSTTQVNED